MRKTTLVLLSLLSLAQGNVRVGDEHRTELPNEVSSRGNPDELTETIRSHATDHGHRDLGLIDGFCNFIGVFLPGRSTCTCTAEGLVIDYECAFNKQVCKDGDETVFCTVPKVFGELNIFKFRLTTNVCTSETRQGGVSVPGLCFEVGGKFFKSLFGGFNSPVVEEDSVKAEGELESCTVQIGDETCYACEICDDGKGYRFDCSEFDEAMVQSQCVAVNGFDGTDFLPILD